MTAYSWIIPTILAELMLAAAAFGQSSSLQDLSSQLGPPQTAILYTAKEIVTLDVNRPTASAVAVVGDRILAVGTIDELVKAVEDRPSRIDRRFKNHVIVPGLIEQHAHPALSSLTMVSEIISIEDWDLPDGIRPAANDAMQYHQRLMEAERSLDDPDEELLTWGYHHYFHGKLTRVELDKLSTTRPIIVWHRSCHEFILNSAAMKKYGIDREFFATFNETQKQQSNFKEGHFWEQGAIAMLSRGGAAVATPKRLQAGLEFSERYMHSSGITTACEPGGMVSRPMQQAINSVFSDDATPFRFYFIVDGKTMAAKFLHDGMITETERVMNWGEGKTAFLPRQVKLLADGAIFSQLMKMRDGYTDGHEGEWIMNPEVFNPAFQKYWDAGYQIHVHQNGDAGLDLLISNLETAMRRTPRDDHRTTVVHFGFSTKSQVEKLLQLGAIVSANPYYATSLADRYGEIGIGPERADQMVRLGDVQRAGISLSLHSDMPMAPGRPLFLMDCAVNRTTFSGRVAGPEQRIDPLTALKAVTIDAAYSLRLENEMGSIVPGKLANFTVLEQNPLNVKRHDIKDIGVWGTVLEGRVQPVTRSESQASTQQLDPSDDTSDRDAKIASIRRLNSHYRSQGQTAGRTIASMFAPTTGQALSQPSVQANRDSACVCGRRLQAALLQSLTSRPPSTSR